MSRRPIVAGNWKMNGTVEATAELINALKAKTLSAVHCDLLIFPPNVFLAQAKTLAGPEMAVGAQDLSEHDSGAYTGEVSAQMLQSLGLKFVLVGHSERRQYHNESNELVAKKALQALQSGITPIVCVGESLEQREAGQVNAVISEQLDAIKSKLSLADLTKIVIAYEPVWAIGTGKTASPEQAQEVHKEIRAWLSEQSEEAANKVRILYGGSVNANNAKELLAQPDIDGGLVGGASLNADSFFDIANAIG